MYIFIFCSRTKTSSIFSDWILFRNCLFRLDPLEELSSETIPFTGSAFFQTISFAGTVLRNHILGRNCLCKPFLYRNCRCRPYPLQELPLQIKFFTHRNCLSHFSHLKNLFLGTITFPGKHLCNYLFPNNITQASNLNIQHKFHFVIFYRRKFRSQTSDNMERWKAEQGRGREKRKIRRKKSRRERARRQKMQMREKVGKSRNTVFFQWFVAPEGRKVGSLKRRVRSQLARWEMKICTPLWREAHFEVKMYKTHQGRTTFGSCDVEKVHAVVARSTFWSQNVQNTPFSDHFWKLRCRKSARRCGAKHISKSKCTKHLSVGRLLEVQMSKKCTPLWREAHFQVKSVKNWRSRTTFGSCDVEKVHAVVARSTFPSQKC